MSVSDTLLAAAAEALAANGIEATADRPARVTVRCGGFAFRAEGVPADDRPAAPPAGFPADALFVCGPSRRILDVMAGATDWITAADIHRRLNPASKADRAPTEMYALLTSLDERKIIESGRAGYRLRRAAT